MRFFLSQPSLAALLRISLAACWLRLLSHPILAAWLRTRSFVDAGSFSRPSTFGAATAFTTLAVDDLPIDGPTAVLRFFEDGAATLLLLSLGGVTGRTTALLAVVFFLDVVTTTCFASDVLLRRFSQLIKAAILRFSETLAFWGASFIAAIAVAELSMPALASDDAAGAAFAPKAAFFAAFFFVPPLLSPARRFVADGADTMPAIPGG
mmetsp:Transcript_50470/g.107492  ORF Transcript_50470/g.107492 Transcript_50470/m.107492 type:complete len:208 (+) Transcript_50470:446-1069(+)